MTATIELLDQAKAAAGCETDYKFAKRFGMTLATVSRWRCGKGTFDDSHAKLIAGLLGRDEAEIMAIAQAERAKDANTRTSWLRAAALIAAAVLPPAAGASQFDNNGSTGGFTRSTICQLWEVRRKLFSGPAFRLA